MKAAIIRAFGGPENFEIADMPVPQPGAGQVLVRVHAASVNPVDYKIRQNGAWAHVPMPAILGYDAAGTQVWGATAGPYQFLRTRLPKDP